MFSFELFQLLEYFHFSIVVVNSLIKLGLLSATSLAVLGVCGLHGRSQKFVLGGIIFLEDIISAWFIAKTNFS